MKGNSQMGRTAVRTCIFILLALMAGCYHSSGKKDAGVSLTSYSNAVWVKHAPLLVTQAALDGTAITGLDAQTLFNDDTDDVYTPPVTARLTVTFPAGTSLSRMKVFGKGNDLLTVYAKAGDTLTSVKGWSVASLSDEGWHTFTASDSVHATTLVLEIVPRYDRERHVQGN